MHGTSNERRALEREALRNVIMQWNSNRLDLFELSEPNEDLEFHGVMRFYFQDSGQKVATKCIRVASDATVSDVIGTLVEKFRPDMRMLSVPQYALYELHEGCPERKMAPDEKPLLVQLNWHVDDREGRFLLKNIEDKTINSMGSLDSNASFRRKLSKREKKQLKKQEKLSRMKSENGDIHGKDGVAEKLYNELPETSFTRSISNPEAVMRRRRQQKLEKKLQQFRSKDGGPDTGGTLKIYGEALCKDVPYKTLLLSVRDCAGAVVREMLDKYGLTKTDPSQWCLVQVTQQPGTPDQEYVLDDDECPLSILMTSQNTGSIMFHVRRRPADCAPRKRKKKPGALARGDIRDNAPFLVELGPDGSAPLPGDNNRTLRLSNDVIEVGSANGIALQLYGPHIQPRHAVISTGTDGIITITPSHADAHTYVNGQRIHGATPLVHGSLIKFGNSGTYRFVDPQHEDRPRPTYGSYDRLSGLTGYQPPARPSTGGGQDPILPAVLEFPEEPQEQFLARVITHLDVSTPTFRLAPAYTLYLCARYRASTHYRPELTPTERAHKLTVLLQHAAALVRHTVQDRSTESTSQAFWLANASELLHFLKSDRHVSAFSLQAQDILADAVQLAFKNLVACLTDELNAPLAYLMSVTGDDHPREVISVLSASMNLLRKCRVNAALTIQLFSQLFHWISAKALSAVISNNNLCTRAFGTKLYNRLRNLQAWAESQGLELAAECHLAKIVQCSHLLQAPKYNPEDLANLSAVCFKLNSMQLGALLMQYKPEPGEPVAPPHLLDHASKAAESVADELLRAEGRPLALHDDPALPCHLLLPDDGYSCDVVHGVPPGLADFLQPLQAAGLCRLAAQPTSAGQWTVYMGGAGRPGSVVSATQPEIQVIRLHKSSGGGMGLSIVAAKGAGQERLGIYIKSVVAGGAADRDGRLAAGDQLLSVDGQSLLGITQEKAAEFLQRTGSVVTLEVAKAGAVYHGLATLLQQPSPQPHRGPRRMSERDLPSKVDSEQRPIIPSSKSVPALHQIHSPNTETPPTVPRPHPETAYRAPPPSSGPVSQNGVRSRSTHNLHQQDTGFYQNLSVYRNKVPSPQQQHLGDRTSALRSSQNSLHSSVISSSQRPSSAYYPPPTSATNPRPNNLHQSIPNLKNPPSTHRLTNDEGLGGGANLHQSIPNLKSPLLSNRLHNEEGSNLHQSIPNLKSAPDGRNMQYGQGYYQYNNGPYGGQNQYYPSHNAPNYPNNIQQPLHINPNSRQDDRQEVRYNNVGGGLLREDVFRQSQNARHDEMMRYPSQSNIRNTSEIPHEIRQSKSEDALRQHTLQNDALRYASTSNIRDGGKVEIGQNRLSNEERHLRGAAKLAEMSEEVRRRQNRIHQQQQQQLPNREYYQQQQQQYYNHVMSQNAQSMQNLNLNQHQHPQYSQQNSYSQNPVSPNYKIPPVAPKPTRKEEISPPELPPTSTHPLYSASSQDPPKMAFYPAQGNVSGGKMPRDPWTREEQERQQEARREAARQWQEHQIRELTALAYRTPQQEEQLRVLRLEREFQRRAMEAQQEEEADEETEKESPTLMSPTTSQPTPPTSHTTITNTTTQTSSTTTGVNKHDATLPPTSILKPGAANAQPPSQPSPPGETVAVPPAPPERGSSFAVMSMRAKESTKRVSFNDASQAQATQQNAVVPNTLQLEEPIREDPNSFIRQAESMLASPVTPTDPSAPGGANMATPGVIGAQEVYRDPRARRLAEQAQKKDQSPVPEKLSFKEKMKMFAMETGEQETPKDRSKISRAQREIDNLGATPPSSSMVH